MRRSAIKRNPEKIRAWLDRSRKPMPKTGKRTKKRQAMNARLNRLGINHCEIRIPGKCVRSIMLTWAHALKSRFLVTDEDWQRAARCCIPCHNHIEALKHEEMAQVVDQAIARRSHPASPEEES